MGSAFVGKTQIVSQFLYDKFSNRYRQTIEELHRGEYDMPDDSSLTLDILDTSGAFAFPAMRDLSISTSNAFILVFSIDNEESWNEVSRLREKVNSTQAILSEKRKTYQSHFIANRLLRNEDQECRFALYATRWIYRLIREG
jgi:GTPase SAR1 family protein